MKKLLLYVLLILSFYPSLTCAQNSEEPYERFIGLGCCCVTRTQINHHLSQRFQKLSNSFGGGQLFDWLVIHNYHKLAEALENGLKDLLEWQDLTVITGWDGLRLVTNTKYEMTWNHLFVPSLVKPMELILRREYHVKKQKINYLANKFRQLSNYRTLYIVAYPFIGKQNRINVIEPDFTALLHLRDALRLLRGNDNFTLLYCPIEKTFDDFENILVRTILPDALDYIGHFDSWNQMLSEFPFADKNAKIEQIQWDDFQNW